MPRYMRFRYPRLDLYRFLRRYPGSHGDAPRPGINTHEADDVLVARRKAKAKAHRLAQNKDRR